MGLISFTHQSSLCEGVINCIWPFGNFSKMVWNMLKKEKSVFSITYLLYVKLRCFGFWPFSITFNKAMGTLNSTVRVTVYDRLWSFIAFAIYIILGYWVIGTFREFEKLNLSLIEIVLNNIVMISDTLVALLCIIMDMVNRNNLWEIITTFSEFDEVVKIYIILLARQEFDSIFFPFLFRWKDMAINSILIHTENGCCGQWQQLYSPHMR